MRQNCACYSIRSKSGEAKAIKNSDAANLMKTETVNALVEPSRDKATLANVRQILRVDDLVPAKLPSNTSKQITKRGRPSTSFLTTIEKNLLDHKLNI